jgi:hypothetical protein
MKLEFAWPVRKPMLKVSRHSVPIIGASVLLLSVFPGAMADSFTSNAQYSVGWSDWPPGTPLQVSSGQPITCTLSSCISNFVPLLAPPPITSFADSGLASGFYNASADQEQDQAQASLTLSPAGPFTSSTSYMTFTAVTFFQVEVIPYDSLLASLVPDVPVLTSAAGSVSCTANAFAVATVNIATAGGSFRANCPLGVSGFDLNSSLLFPDGQPVNVTTSAAGGMAQSNPSCGPSLCPVTDSFSAMVDPTFEIDPSFPMASDFYLAYSPGYTPAAPEPRFTMLCGAALTLAVWLRRRSRLSRRTCPE